MYKKIKEQQKKCFVIKKEKENFVIRKRLA